MHSPLRLAPAAVSSLLVCFALLAATVGLTPRAAQADPPPPFIVQLPAALASPSGVANDAAGNVYIADTGNNRVLKFSNVGSLLASWGTLGSANGQFNQPWGIAVDAANVYVGDSGNNRVQKFTQAGAFVSTWTVAGAHGVASDGIGNLYVVGTSAISKYTVAGALVTSWGSAGAGNSQFNAPFGIAADAAGNVYVADTNNGRVQKFTAAGAYVSQWGGLVTPYGVCVDNGGHVIVTETGGYRMDSYTSAGALISQWGTQGAGAGQFQLARAVVTNATGNVLVLDSGNQRLQVFGTVTSVSMTANVNPSVFGQPVTLTATVSPVTVSGLTYFKDNGAVIGAASPSSLVVSNLPVGSHPLIAYYGGDANSAVSTSPGVAMQVNKAASNVALASSLNPSGVTQSVTFTATVTAVAPGTGIPTGGVTFLVNGVPTLVALSAGAAALTLATLPEGANAVSASYSGDSGFSPTGPTAMTQSLVSPESVMPYFTQWGSFGTGAGQFKGSDAIAVSSSGFVYVLETTNDRIQKFDLRGNYLGTWGSPGTSPGLLLFGGGITTDSAGNVYVADSGNSRVQKFTADGTFLLQWGTTGTGDGQFNHPTGVALDALGNIYVADSQNNRIQKFTTSGAFLAKWGTAGVATGQFGTPIAVAVGPNGNLYVVDLGNVRIQEFTPSGAFVTAWGGAGCSSGQFTQPQGIAIDRAGNVYVAGSNCQNIQKFTSSGAFLSQWSPDLLNGAYVTSYGVALDAAGNVYAADHFNSRIVRYSHLQKVTAVTDIKGDQGHQVRLRIAANGSDAAGSGTVITSYEVYRRINAANGAPLAASRARSAPTRAQSESWDYVATIPARGDSSYNAVIPTLADSSATGTHWSSFFVSATTSSPTTNFFSAADSGYSVDNLPPATPAPFTAAYTSGASDLHWGRNTESDLWYYRLYRGAAAGFVPSPANLIATRSDTGYVDPGPAGNWYALSAVDVNGNESGYATMAPGGTLAVGPAPPLAFALAGTRPNPARGANLGVEFVLAQPLPASIELLDVTGRMVAAREVGSLGIGRHVVDLAAGRRIPPGVYMIRLTQGRNWRSVRAVVLE